MSSTAVGWALDSRRTGPLDPAARLVLVVLADHAHADGSSAFPSKTTIAERIGVDPRTVQRHLAALAALDLIVPGDNELVSHIRSDRRPNVWDLALDARGDNLSPRAERGDTHGATGRQVGAERGDTGVSQTKNITNPEKTPQTPRARHDAERDAAASLNLEHAAAENLPRVTPPAPRGACPHCGETRLLVADGMCRPCLIADTGRAS